MSGLSIKEMIDAGVHFGHRSKYWNPKMEPYIYTTHKKLHIINLEKSSEHYNIAAKYIQKLISNNGKLMFIGTKRAASEIVKKYSDLTSMPYVNNRWLGGLLTNFNTIRKSIAKLEDLRTKLKNQKIYNLSKKQIIDLKRDIERLEKNLLGVQNLTKLPDAIFVIDTRYERIAIQEANKLNIPVIALVDSNNSFDGVDYMIPANDDAMSSIDLFLRSISEIIMESKPKKSTQVSDANTDQKKSIKAKKVVKAPEQKKLAKPQKMTPSNHPLIRKKKVSESLQLVKQLREITGAGMLDCKKYLEKTNNNLDEAIKLFRSESGKKAEKKGSRIAAEGIVNFYENADSLLILELNSETDFVAKDNNFVSLAESIGTELLTKNESEAKTNIDEMINSAISKLGENIKLRRFSKIDKKNYVYAYSHNNKIVSTVELEVADDNLAKDICMQIVASNPLSIDESSIDETVLKSEKDIYKKELDNLDKKEDIKRNILEGKMKKFINDNTLLNQPFVKDPSTSLSKIIKNNHVLSFNRYEVGEGLEKKSEDFAQEVYNQIS